MINYIRSLWRPAVYHGKGKKANYFEGWFYKVVDEAKVNVYAFIPGVILGEDSHAFIQILDGQTHQSSYLRFPIANFRAAKNKFEIQIGNNIFTSNFMDLNIDSPKSNVKGKLIFTNLKPWPVRLFSPGIMGCYAFVPFMECFHGVISLDHQIEGNLSINEQQIDFRRGRGYIEKDWGKSFPSSYIWIQSNHFDQKGVSLVASVAKIPWLTSSFRGFIIGLLIDGKLYKFTTYTGAKIKYLNLSNYHVKLEINDKKFKLKIEAQRKEGGLLLAPYKMTIFKKVSETLSSQVKVDLYEQNKNREVLIFSGEGKPAALDANGKLEEIIDVFK